MYKLAVAARDKGQITDRQLVDGIASYFKSGTAINYAVKGMGKFAIPYRPSYVAKGQASLALGNDMIDWARPESVLAYHTREQAAKRYMNSAFPVIPY